MAETQRPQVLLEMAVTVERGKWSVDHCTRIRSIIIIFVLINPETKLFTCVITKFDNEFNTV